MLGPPVTESHDGAPIRAVSTPFAPAVRFAPSESVPRGSRAVSPVLARRRLTGRQHPCLCGRAFPRSTASSGQRVQRPSGRASSLGPPSESQRRYPGPVARLPSITGHRPPPLPARPAPRTSALHRAAGSARGRSRPRPAPPPQGLRAPAHKSGSERKSAVEAIGRFINQSPGCRQGTILAPVAAWHPCPAAGPFRPWDILERRRDLGVARGT